MINTKLLLFISSLAIGVVYCVLFPTNKIINIILDEYITIIVAFVSMIVYFRLKSKLKDKLIFEFIPNTNYVDIKSSFLFFIFFEIIDFYFEDGYIGMVKLWFSYWVFGVIAYFVTHSINFYKNIQAYKMHNAGNLNTKEKYEI
jgi:hypothetical protein